MKELVRASRYIGSRFDLVQSGGGNTSVKEDGFLYVKSSGTYLGDMTIDSGITKLDLNVLSREIQEVILSDVDDLDKKTLENTGAEILKKAYVAGNKSSIETFLHASFKKYVLHTHPIPVSFSVSTNVIDTLHEMFPEAFISEYRTPGIELLLGVKEYLGKQVSVKGPVIIFLKNHGLVVSADTAQEAIDCTNRVCDAVSQYINFDLSAYKKSGDIFNVLSDLSYDFPIVSLVQNKEISNYIENLTSREVNSFRPDIFIYLGWAIPDISFDIRSSFQKFKTTYHAYPSVFTFDGNVYIQGPSYKKIKEIEDVLLSYVKIMLVDNSKKIRCLAIDELRYLSNWDAEKYRKNN
jgi:rhamnose utilization protein RhaD (predicted bifunctional aldolase and dehydrogenase)